MSLQTEVFWYTRIYSLLVNGVITALGCDQQNMEKILSDFKWAGHRLAHIFADGWSTGSNGKGHCWRRPQGHYFLITKTLSKRLCIVGGAHRDITF